jgi:predicted nucleic acid-binding Zn ribbon protein
MPEKIGTVLNSVLQRYGISARIEQERLFNEWHTLSQNDIFNFCYPQYIEDKCLYLKAKDDYWRAALKGREKELYKLIDTRFALKQIKYITII